MKMSKNLAACIDNGREARVTLNCDALLTEDDGCTVEVKILDVSQDGFRLQSVEELEVGSEVQLHVHKLPPVRAQIRWTCGHQAGGLFLDPVAL
jgi:hypothetical protein